MKTISTILTNSGQSSQLNQPSQQPPHQQQQQSTITTTTTTTTINSSTTIFNQPQANSIITSVERPTSPQTTTTTTVTNDKQVSNNNNINNPNPGNSNNVDNHHFNHHQDHSITNPVIISQLQQLQSPPPQLSTPIAAAINAGGDPTIAPINNHNNHQQQQQSPITQVTKSRHRGFLSQLLCCFRPTSSNIYQDSNSIYNHNTNNNNNNNISSDVLQHHNSINQKYSGKYLLPARKTSDNRICLVIDLDETLVHSSFKAIDNADFIVPVEIDGTLHKVYVLKRPHVDEFLKRMGQLFECVLFTASLAKYADPVADLLDPNNIFKARLFRESCAFYRGNYVKDLSRLGRDLNRVIIVDNSPASYIFHPDNAVSAH